MLVAAPGTTAVTLVITPAAATAVTLVITAAATAPAVGVIMRAAGVTIMPGVPRVPATMRGVGIMPASGTTGRDPRATRRR